MQPFPHRHQLAAKQLLYLDRVRESLVQSQDKQTRLVSQEEEEVDNLITLTCQVGSNFSHSSAQPPPVSPVSCCNLKKKVKASSYIAQYPVLRTIQIALHFTSLFTQTPSRLLWDESSHMLQLMREGCSYTYPPLSIARYSFIQLSKLEQCRVNNLPQGFNTAAQDSNPGSRSRESEALPLSHCGLHHVHNQVHLWFNFVKLSSSSLFLFL